MEYMSQEGYDKIAAELNQLIKVDLPRVKDAIAEARAMGDLSENFEYHAAKREQGKILSRINYLQGIIENVRVVDMSHLGNDKVGLLSKVEFTNLANNARMTYTIVSPHESDLKVGKMSVQSPIGEALMDHKVGDIVEAVVPAGTLKFRIEKITRE